MPSALLAERYVINNSSPCEDCKILFRKKTPKINQINPIRAKDAGDQAI
jgi:hypothetical protein